MLNRLLSLLVISALSLLPLSAQQAEDYPADYASKPRFSLLVYYSEQVEVAHLQFAQQAVEFLHRLSYGEGFTMRVVKSFEEFDHVDKLRPYDVVVMLNVAPSSPATRQAFEQYMEEGGGWMGFHAAAYNDRHTHWPWLLHFLGCGTFYCNNWPPQSVLLEVNAKRHPVTRNLPRFFVSAPSEWYMWNPSPRKSRQVEVLLSLSKRNFPLGIKDVIRWGDFPVVWTNRDYRMIYFNFGHGDESFLSMPQNLLIVNALQWLTTQRRAASSEPLR